MIKISSKIKAVAVDTQKEKVENKVEDSEKEVEVVDPNVRCVNCED